MSIFEESDEEIFIQPVQPIRNANEKKKQEDCKLIKEKKITKPKMTEQIVEKKKQVETIKQTAIKSKNTNLIVDVEKSDGKFNFCESLVRDIKINKKNQVSQFFDDNNVNLIYKSKVEQYYELMFKNHNKFDFHEYISSIENAYVEFQNSETIFNLYFEMMKIIEKNDVGLLKNLVFYFHIKELELKSQNITNEVNSDKLVPTQSKKKRKRSISNEKPTVIKKKKKSDNINFEQIQEDLSSKDNVVLNKKGKKVAESKNFKLEGQNMETIKEPVIKNKCPKNSKGEATKENNKTNTKKAEVNKSLKKKVSPHKKTAMIIENKINKNNLENQCSIINSNNLFVNPKVIHLNNTTSTKLTNEESTITPDPNDSLYQFLNRNANSSQKNLPQQSTNQAEKELNTITPDTAGWNFNISSFSIEDKDESSDLVELSLNDISFKSKWMK